MKSLLGKAPFPCMRQSAEKSPLRPSRLPLAARNAALLGWKVPLLVVLFRCRCGFGPELRQAGLSKAALSSGGIWAVQRCGKRSSPHPVVGAGGAWLGFSFILPPSASMMRI